MLDDSDRESSRAVSDRTTVDRKVCSAICYERISMNRRAERDPSYAQIEYHARVRNCAFLLPAIFVGSQAPAVQLGGNRDQ